VVKKNHNHFHFLLAGKAGLVCMPGILSQEMEEMHGEKKGAPEGTEGKDQRAQDNGEGEL
jgi:hypothetical protein